MWAVRKYCKDWPSKPDKAIEYFHRKVLLGTLQRFANEIGYDKFEKLQLLFPEFRNCGYDLKEIKEGNHELISLVRKSYGDRSPSVSELYSS